MSKKKKVKLPLIFKIIRWLFPKLEKLAPSLAGYLARRIFFHPFRYKTPQRELIWREKAESFLIEYNGKNVMVYVYGEGVPVVMTHGWSGRGTQFLSFIEKFIEKGFKVVTFDAPGHGLSSGRETSVIEFAALVKLLAEKYKAEFLIGHSLGGAASLLAMTQGLSVRNLIMIGSPAEPDYLIREFLGRLNATQKSFDDIRNHVFRRTGRNFEEFMVSHLLTQVEDLNLMLIHDEDDKDVPLIHSEKVKEMLPSAKLIVTSGLGHHRILRDKKVVDIAIEFAGMKASA